MTTIKLQIPDDIASSMKRLTGNVEKYIIDLLRSKVKELEKPKSLADEYRMAGAENVGLNEDFAKIDIEGWDDKY
jgi:hypothetical protein